MADVGVRELKARLSEFLDRAASGEIIRVTERGQPKALLGPLPGRSRLDEGIAAGWIRAPQHQPVGPWRRFRATKAIADLMAEDRGA